MIAAGLVGIAASWLVGNPRSRVFQGTTLGAVFVTALFPQSIEISTRSFYSTDSAAFDQVAAHALAHGADPYVASMSRVAGLLNVPSHFWTYTVEGGHVTQFSYPAGSFLLSLPATVLGVRMAVDWTELVAWLATIVLLFALLPASLRWLGALVGLTPFFLGSFTSGGTDALFLPFLVLAVWRWDRYCRPGETGLARWIGPIALGAACSIKQTPWFVVPMLVTGIYLEARQREGSDPARLALRYSLTVLATFAAVNLPFLVWHPSAWAHGTVIPLTGGLVADGQGLVTLATHGLTGGVNLEVLSIAGALAMVGAVAALIAWYPLLKRIWPLLVTIPFFFSPRSLSSYLVDLFPVALIAALTVDGVERDAFVRPPVLRERLARPAVLAVALSAIGVAIASLVAFNGPPLQLKVRSVVASPTRQLKAVTITVMNETSGTLVPHFMVNAATSENLQGFWTSSSGAVVTLGPHESETVTLHPPAPVFAPRRGAHWLVEAYTGDPSWLSTSPLETFPPPSG